MQHSIREIFNHNARSLSFEENYRHAYNMCLQKQGSHLYEGVSELIVKNLDKLAKEQIVPAFPTSISVRGIDHVQQAQEGERLLKAVRAVWDDHISSMSKLRDLLKYMASAFQPSYTSLLCAHQGCSPVACSNRTVHTSRQRESSPYLSRANNSSWSESSGHQTIPSERI